MEFIEGGFYRPIRVLFDTPIYERALQICWHVRSYKSQIALMMEFLRLQQENLIPSQVTSEEMIDFICKESKSSLREQLWEFELADFDEDEAKPLLMLVWAVNVSHKMRDIECEAKFLLNSPEAVPANFTHPKIQKTARKYAEVLSWQHEAVPRSRTVSPREAVIEVIPKVLQGFWALPQCPLLNMPSRRLSNMSVGVAQAVLDRMSGTLTPAKHEATFSHSIRDDLVLSVLTEIRQTLPEDVLKSRIKNFAPELLNLIVKVAVENICCLFQPQSSKVPLPATESPATDLCQDDLDLAITEEQVAPNEPPSEIQSRVDLSDTPSLDDLSCLEKMQEQTTEPESDLIRALLTLPAPPPSSENLDRVDLIEAHSMDDLPCLEEIPELCQKPESVAPQRPSADFLAVVIEPKADLAQKPHLDDLPSLEEIPEHDQETETDVAEKNHLDDLPSLEEIPEQRQEPESAAPQRPSSDFLAVVIKPRADVCEKHHLDDLPSLEEIPEQRQEPESAAPQRPSSDFLAVVIKPRADVAQKPHLDDLPSLEEIPEQRQEPETETDVAEKHHLDDLPSLEVIPEQRQEPESAAPQRPSSDFLAVVIKPRADVAEKHHLDDLPSLEEIPEQRQEPESAAPQRPSSDFLAVVIKPRADVAQKPHLDDLPSLEEIPEQRQAPETETDVAEKHHLDDLPSLEVIPEQRQEPESAAPQRPSSDFLAVVIKPRADVTEKHHLDDLPSLEEIPEQRQEPESAAPQRPSSDFLAVVIKPRADVAQKPHLDDLPSLEEIPEQGQEPESAAPQRPSAEFLAVVIKPKADVAEKHHLDDLPSLEEIPELNRITDTGTIAAQPVPTAGPPSVKLPAPQSPLTLTAALEAISEVQEKEKMMKALGFFHRLI